MKTFNAAEIFTSTLYKTALTQAISLFPQAIITAYQKFVLDNDAHLVQQLAFDSATTSAALSELAAKLGLELEIGRENTST